MRSQQPNRPALPRAIARGAPAPYRARTPMRHLSQLAFATVLLVGCGGGGTALPYRETAVDGKVLVDGQLVGGVQDGNWIYYWPDGSRRAGGPWRNDKREGRWLWWHRDGGLATSGSYVNGLQDGLWQYVHQGGKRASEGSYREARQHGPWRYWDSSGKEIASGLFVDGARTLGWRFADGRSGCYWGGVEIGWWTGPGEAVDKGVPAGWTVQVEGDEKPPRRWVAKGPGATVASVREADGSWLTVVAGMSEAWLAGFDQQGKLVCAGSGQAITQDPLNMKLVADPLRAEGEWLLDLGGEGRYRCWMHIGTVQAMVADGAVPPAALLADDAQGGGDPARQQILLGAAASTWSAWQQRTAAALYGRPEVVVTPVAVALADPTPTPPSPATPELSPIIPDDPQPLTVLDLKKVQAAEKAYTTDGVLRGEGYVSKKEAGKAPPPPTFAPGADAARWVGQELSQRRFLGAGGAVVDLDAYRDQGSVVLVILRGFAGSVCPYCTAQTRALSAGVGRFKEAGAQVIYVYPGSAASVPVFLNSLKTLSTQGTLPELPVLLDVDLAFVRSLGIEGELAKPTSIVIDRRGRISYAYVGRDLTDRPTVDKLLDEARRAAAATQP